ncbi:VWA domain-containing protein [Bremerella cremea]|uniref:VWA domain-containing protein n=1 Tax=Bremerella cremea TaxID=1031537 RepID=A0A368KV76_9BACT|nr:BatA domain-containing protein [Bremerella cremea]RCS54221.1 VWA domain-containing protein [Bremerella cremea]
MFPTFVASGFAIAGAVMMLGPALIHLLNRNRYRTVQWAAMDFLLEAMQTNRRILRIRDLLLMILRAAALLLFGLALARPYFASPTDNPASAATSRPPHAILVIDNSLSSTLESISGSVLDQAKQQARQFVETLPANSRISILPLCGSQSQRISDPFSSRLDAVDAIDKVAATHGAGELSHALNQARSLAEATASHAPNVVIFGDQQAAQWQRLARTNPPEEAMPVLVVGNESPPPDNAWIEEFGLPDGLAELGLTSRFVATIGYHGKAPRSNVPVTLKVRGNEIETKFVDFPSGDSTHTLFFDYVFDPMDIDPTRNTSIPISISLAGDALTADDSRSLVVPLIAATPVVFIDQWSEAEESPDLGRVGDTWTLRQLLSPKSDSSRAEQHLIRAIHLSQREAEGETLRAALRDARLTIVSGIEAPSANLVDTLHSYVRQGGQLAIAASDTFNPAAWNDVAWRNGQGILPRPLRNETIGHSLDELSEDLRPFRIASPGLLDHAYFQIANLDENQLLDLYTDALFFKTVVPQTEASSAASPPRDEERWLSWSPPVSQLPTSDVASTTSSAVATTIAQFDNGIDFVVERKMGQGKVVFFSSGVSSNWSTLPSTNAVLIFDRVLRNQLASTFQRINFTVGETALLPLPAGAGDANVQVESPGSGVVSSVPPRFLNDTTRGVLLDNLNTAGLYWLSDRAMADPLSPSSETSSRYRIPISAKPVAWESELVRLDQQAFEALGLPGQFRWQASTASLTNAGLHLSGHSWWQWLICLVIVLLLAEMTIAATPSWLSWLVRRKANGEASAS